MKTSIFPTISGAGLLAGAALICAALPARAADPVPADAFPNFESYVKISGKAAAISGDKTAFENRTMQVSDGAGIEDLHITKDTSKTTTVVIDGKALVGSEDYLGKVNVSKTDLGSVDFGFKRFRTFYDDVGGFFPLNKEWLTIYPEGLHIDRSKFWVEGNLTLPDAPVVTIRYTNELRSGKKDSTIWGDTDYTGLPFTVAPNPVSQARKIVPSYIKVGERHEMLELSAKHTVGKTTMQVTLLADRTNNSDTRYLVRFPNEIIPFSIVSLASAAQPAAKAALSPAAWNNQVAIAETDAMKTQTTGANFESESVLTSKITLKVARGYDLVHTTIGGGRPLTTLTDTATGTVPVVTDNYQGLSGGTRVKDFTGNVALDLQPTSTLFVKLALRAQDEFMSGTSSYNVIAASGTPAVTIASTPRTGFAKIHQNVQTPVLEFRYTGIRDLAIYFNGSKRSLDGEERNSASYNPLTAVAGTLANNDVSEDHGNYTLGANWRQSAFLTLRGEVFHKDHKDNTVGFGVTVGDYYLLDSQYTGYKLTALAHPLAQLGFTTRFIEQHGTMQVTGFQPTYPAYDSLNAKNYMLSETIDWTPSTQCYVQLAGTATFNVISTIYPRAGITPATSTTDAFDSNRVLQNSNNNYVTGSLLTGFVVDKKTDLQVQANYYKAGNGNANLYPLTQPYGVSVRDVSCTVGIKHKFSDRLVASAKVGYFDSVNDTSGGFLNYHGPLAYVSFDHAF